MRIQIDFETLAISFRYLAGTESCASADPILKEKGQGLVVVSLPILMEKA